MSNEIASIKHPQMQQEYFAETVHLGQAADNALHATTQEAQAQSVASMRQELDQMTPVERMNIARILNREAPSLKRFDAEEKGQSGAAVPLPILQLDSKGDIKSLSFKSISSDSAYGKTVDIDLSQRRTDEGANTKELKLADGTTRVVQTDNQGNPTSIQDSSGVTFKRGDDGHTWTRGDSNTMALDQKVKDLKVNPDGSLSYNLADETAPEGLKVSGMTEKVLPNGATSLTMQATGPDGKPYTIETVQHTEYPDDGKTSVIESTITHDDRGHSDFEKVSSMLNGDTITETPGSKVTTSRSGDQMIVENLDPDGKPEAGKVSFNVTRDEQGNFKSGTIDATFPDGKSKHFDHMTENDWKQFSQGSSQRIKWVTKDGDPDHFKIESLQTGKQ